MQPIVSRVAWQALEAVNAVTYFSPECRDAYRDIGLRGFWMGYFAGRAAPMGAVSPGVVEAAFYNFHPDMVRHSIPDAWTFSRPEPVIRARAAAAAAAIGRMCPGADRVSAELLPLLIEIVAEADGAGRPLFSANREVMTGGSVAGGLDALWQAATTLREHRGDGHIAILTEAAIDGCEAHVLHAAIGRVPVVVLRDNRGWSEADWDAATQRVQGRGWLDASGQPTAAGHQERERIERRTDQLALQPYRRLGEEKVERVLRLAGGLARDIIASGEIPFPNPIGLPDHRETGTDT